MSRTIDAETARNDSRRHESTVVAVREDPSGERLNQWFISYAASEMEIVLCTLLTDENDCRLKWTKCSDGQLCGLSFQIIKDLEETACVNRGVAPKISEVLANACLYHRNVKLMISWAMAEGEFLD
ncbi:hypothetical protein ACJ73_10075 [Blastomyces percursus]|uniref:Uncharacterized protein n=1 Tax=Blastomyces percursus TaxID=1658174 RepID=A0A1J9Q1H7_9EURO|nr:hypothetical protein ACJ73_10075 [Blastomyces percursus]